MDYRVFTQTPEGWLDPAALVRGARRFFETSLEVLSVADPEVGRLNGGMTKAITLRAIHDPQGFSGVFSVRVRPVTPEDWSAAQAAEQRGQAAGMSSLAARCSFVWQVSAEGQAHEIATLSLCGILATVGLGPVLPPDESTLFGVRGAMDRIARLSSKAAPASSG